MAWEIDEKKLREGERKYLDELNRRFKLKYEKVLEERGYIYVSELNELAEEVRREYDLERQKKTIESMKAGEITFIDFSLMET